MLPLTCYAIGSFAIITMLTKNTFVEEIRKQYVLAARAKGLSERKVLYKHVFRNALIPIVTGFPAAFVGAFFAGSLLIETIFSLDGLGLLSYESVIQRDYPGGAGHALPLHADRPGRQADRRPRCTCASIPRVQFEAVAQMSTASGARGRERRAAGCGDGAARDLAVAQPAGLAALQAQPAGLRLADPVRRDARRRQPLPRCSPTSGRSSRTIDGQWHFPVVRNQPETRFGGDFSTPTD